MQSRFSAQTLAEIFRDLYLHERTGCLVLTRDGEERHVYFDRGMILYTESGIPEENLGDWLVRSGRLSQGAQAEARESLAGAEDTPAFARALIQRELLGRPTLERARRSVVERVVQAVFEWEGGSARFVETDPLDTVFETDTVTTVNIILAGIARMAGFEPIHEAMQGLDNRLAFATPAPIPLERLALSPAHGFILSRVDGNTNLNELISILPPGEDETAARFIFGLLVMGVMRYEPTLSMGLFQVADILRDHADRRELEAEQEAMVREAFEGCRERAAHEILGVEPSAPREAVEEAYETRKARFGRDRILPTVREKFRSELTLIESRLIEAFLTLTQPDRAASGGSGEKPRPAPRAGVTVDDLNVRVEMDKADARIAAEKAHRIADAYYTKGRRSMLEGDYHNAIQYGKLAISYNASDARYFFLIGDCQSRNPDARWQRAAEENFTKATELDPWNAEYWIRLGRLYKKRGLNLRARRQFEEALKLVPNHPDVSREMEGLG